MILMMMMTISMMISMKKLSIPQTMNSMMMMMMIEALGRNAYDFGQLMMMISMIIINIDD